MRLLTQWKSFSIWNFPSSGFILSRIRPGGGGPGGAHRWLMRTVATGSWKAGGPPSRPSCRRRGRPASSSGSRSGWSRRGSRGGGYDHASGGGGISRKNDAFLSNVRKSCFFFVFFFTKIAGKIRHLGIIACTTEAYSRVSHKSGHRSSNQHLRNYT